MATKVYRDFGVLNDMDAPNNEFDIKRYTQVYQATHEGEQRLPFMNRSFISFSFDDPDAEQPKCIEDFDFIAYTAGDRIERDAYGSFEDLTSTYDVIPGQFYWGTYFHQNTLTFDLATDGIDQEKLDAFKYWFRPGIIRELILSEHPNRAILARVSTPPRLKLLAFEHPVELTMNNGRTYKTSTTLYKGEVELEFTMDEPFWYAKKDILGRPHTAEGYYDSTWKDVNGVVAQIVDSPDALKIIYEDHIPIGSMANINVFYGDQIYVTMKSEGYSKVCMPSSESDYAKGMNDYASDPQMQSMYIRWPDEDGAEHYDYYYGARIVKDGIGGRIAGATVEEETNGIELYPPNSGHDQTAAYLYYAGNAPSPVTLNFTLTPQFDGFYIVSPWNKQGHPNEPYNTITLKATAEHTFKFSLPNLYRSYNNLITILKNDTLVAVNNSWETVRETIRDTIKHPKVREWANLALDKFITKGSNGIIQESEKKRIGTLLTYIKKMLAEKDLEGFPASFKFNAKDGTAIGTFTIRTTDYFDEIAAATPAGQTSDTTSTENPTSSETEESSTNTTSDDDGEAAAADDGEGGTSTGTEVEVDPTTDVIPTEPTGEEVVEDVVTKTYELEENVGDMVKSNYIILDERNVLTSTYQVAAWEAGGGENNSYLITHNVPNGLTKLQFIFKNMYL